MYISDVSFAVDFKWSFFLSVIVTCFPKDETKKVIIKCDRHFDFNATILCGMLGFCCFCGFYFNLDNFKTIFSEILVRLCHYSSILRMSVVLLVIRGHVLKIISQPRMKSEQNMPKPKQTFIHYSAADTRSLSSISSCHFSFSSICG